MDRERLIVDTSVLVAAERGRLDLGAVAADDADAAVPAIAVAEFVAGIHLAATRRQALRRRRFIDRVLSALPVEEYTQRVAEAHGALLAFVRRNGEARGAHDLIVAATGVATGRVVVTADERSRLDQLPDVRMRMVAPG